MINIKYLSIVVFLFLFTGCKKCNLKGENLITEEFNQYGNWELYSEYDEDDAFYSRIENGALRLKTDQAYTSCQRATYYFIDDLSSIKGFQACIHINKLELPKDVDVHFYFSLGNFELHATIEKKKSSNTVLILRADEDGIRSNLKGAIHGHLGNEFEGDNNTLNFIQISLCPEAEEESTGQLYIEIDKLEITVLE